MSHTLSKLPPRELPDYLLSQGLHAITVAEAAAILGLDHRSTLSALQRLRKQGKLFSPARGLFIVIPPDYRSWGAVPAAWFIDAMMTHLNRPYYVALLSAAAMHGAAHQSPQALQVMTTKAVKDRAFGRVRLRFYVNADAECVPTETFNVPTGTVTVSTREATVVDLVAHVRDAGGLGNVATIMKEIGELRGSELARLASQRGRSLTRRVGWLVAQFGRVDDLEALRQAGRVDLGDPVPLDPGGRRRGSVDKEWGVRLNAAVEPDV